ncbi:MAG: hypothetical protein KF894_28500 [Labilithrix sp.]|nr:hypothetical protein [Labilithrix sp.]
MRRLHGLLVCASVVLLGQTASAQGLAPPPPMNPGSPGSAPGSPTVEQQQQGATTRRLDEAEQQDSGRNFELFWIDGSIGGSYINMSQFSSESFQIEKASAGGPAFSLGAGARFVILVVGARLRHNALSTFNMWQLNAEAGFKIPIRSFDVLFGLHGGYSFVGRLGDAGLATNTETPASNDAVSIRGFNAGVDVAFDYYVSPLFSVGAGILGDFLFLNRPPVGLPANYATLTPDQQAAINGDPVYQRSGTSAGLQLAGGLRLGLHFGL